MPANPTTKPQPPEPAALELDTEAVVGDDITLTATFPPMNEVPEVSLTCTAQDGTEVYLSVQTGDGSQSPWQTTWTLWSETWRVNNGGPASCVARLYYYTWQGKRETGIVYLAQLSFDAVL